jgi:hypothetical protein
MNKLILLLFLVTIICSSTDAWAQSPTLKKNYQLGDVVVHKEKKVICKVVKILGDGLYVLDPISNIEQIITTQDEIWEGKVRWTENKFSDGTTVIDYPTHIQDKNGNYIVGEAKTNPSQRNVGRFSGRPRPIVTQLKQEIQKQTISRQQLIDKLLKENKELKTRIQELEAEMKERNLNGQ